MELDKADLEFQSNASSISKNKFSKKSDFVASLDCRRKANKDQNLSKLKLPKKLLKKIFFLKKLTFIEILSEKASPGMDQSDLQLYSLDKDLVDSRPKADQNLQIFIKISNLD